MKLQGVLLPPCFDISSSKGYQPALLFLILLKREDQSLKKINRPWRPFTQDNPLEAILGLTPSSFADVTRVMCGEPELA